MPSGRFRLSRLATLILAAAALLTLAACGEFATATLIPPTVTPTQTATARPTMTPAPTQTIAVTPTPRPVPTAPDITGGVLLQGSDGKTYTFLVSVNSQVDLAALANNLFTQQQVTVTYRGASAPYEVVGVR